MYKSTRDHFVWTTKTTSHGLQGDVSIMHAAAEARARSRNRKENKVWYEIGRSESERIENDTINIRSRIV